MGIFIEFLFVEYFCKEMVEKVEFIVVKGNEEVVFSL